MDTILQSKLQQLQNANDYECWYLVKQPTEFSKLCYLVFVLKSYQEEQSNDNLSKYIEDKIRLLKEQKPSVQFSDNYRALRVAAFFGLITLNGANYKNAIITPTFYEISNRCNNEFENTDVYDDIIDRQIEKMFLSSEIDEEKDGIRKEFRLYPVMLLYKVLIEIGRITGNYQINLVEYKYFVATTKKFEDYLDALIFIKMLRKDNDAVAEFEKFSAKFDNRIIQALKQLTTLNVNLRDNSISIKSEKIAEVAKKVFIFENNKELFFSDNYLEFLASTRSLIDLDCKESLEYDDNSSPSIEWFKNKADEFKTIDDEAKSLYEEFREKFAPEILESVEGVDLLHKIFLNETNNNDSLCYTLEYDKRYSLFGSVAGGSSFKYGLFYKNDKKSWMAGASRKPRLVSVNEAISIGTEIRDEIVAGAKVISNYGAITQLKDYASLYAQLYSVMPNTINKSWVMMYYHMIFPELFPVFYNCDWQNKVLEKLNIETDDNSFIRMGKIALFVKQCGISNVVFSKIIDKVETPSLNSEDIEKAILPYTYNSSKGGAQNIVIYGTPGCGKSYYVQNTLLNNFDISIDNTIRTTFYQDYTNTDFIGQILPTIHEDKTVTYEFNPGPFAIALKKAIMQPDVSVALIIEELNRGNAASIFGDLFQLLDRDETGKSQYGITNVLLQDYLNDCFEDQGEIFNDIYIPSNLYVIATMNTSDQNVFTLDTAFKRRWEFEKLRNIFANDHEYKAYFVPGMSHITWEHLVNDINNFILNNSNELTSEDKQLGVYFISKEILCENEEECSNNDKKKKFAYKLFEYLWDDVAKFSRSDWFGSDIRSLDELIDTFFNKGEKVFADGIIK